MTWECDTNRKDPRNHYFALSHRAFHAAFAVLRNLTDAFNSALSATQRITTDYHVSIISYALLRKYICGATIHNPLI